MKIVIATRNKGKVREIEKILEGLPVEILTLEDFPSLNLPQEDALTFKDNALIKARYAAGKTGLPALADDSGLSVDCLGGRPGVLSARYAGAEATDEENYTKLLGELKGVPRERRSARFVCALAFVDPGGEEAVFEGVFEGVIAEAPSGKGGFGYDPVFFVPGKNRTVAELDGAEKNSISHRARALNEFKKWLDKRP